MQHRRGTCAVVFLAGAAALLAGCIERRETLTIEPDGQVRIQVRYETESFDEMFLGDAVPTVAGGWLVDTTSERTEEGKEKHTLLADAFFPPGAELPASYADPRQPDPDLPLQFPTSLEIEERADGTYYHFARIYRSRPWAFLETPRQMLQKQLDPYKERDLPELTGAERVAMLRALVQFETLKFEAFARSAFREALPDAPQDAWLAVHAAMMEVARTRDYDRILAALIQDDAERDEVDADALAAESEAFEEAALDATRRALRERGGFSHAKIREFMERLAWHRQFFEITEELGDDTFTIVVRMPGELVGHNGTSVKGAEVTWEFNGQMIRDRDLELMATSRVLY